VVVNELQDINNYPLPKCSDQFSSEKSDFELVQVSNELGCEPLSEVNNTSDMTFNMDNTQNQDNLINVPMTSSSNSTCRISKDKTVFIFVCNLSNFIKLCIFFIDKRSLTPKKSVKRMCYVGDFKLSDLDSPRKRRCYWTTTVKSIKMYKQKLNANQKKKRQTS